MNYRTTTLLALMMGITLQAGAEPVPAQLPDPDGKPGDATKPVKVYILAGQSNMVGFGTLKGATCPYAGIYLTADPAAPIGPLSIYKVGNYKIARLSLYLPDGTETDKPVAQGQLEVPEAGIYRVHCGSGESSSNVMELDGKEVYRKEAGGQATHQEVTLQPGQRYAFKVSGFTGDPPRFWMEKTDLLGQGDLESLTKREGRFPWLIDDAGNWTVRNDVWFQEARIAPEGKGSPLSPTSNGSFIDPALGFGYVVGTYHDEQVLLIKTAMGNRALGFDFRPPSSGRTDPDNKWESLEYKLMIEGVHKTLDRIDKIIPGYKGQGYEMTGFVWWQGHKDAGATKAEYEKNLVNLINDVRKEFKAPKMLAVVATVGFGGHNMGEDYLRILDAQMAVGDPKQHPEFAGTVASVDTRDFWRETDESPSNPGYHYNKNAETYMLTGDSLGRAMVGLLGGKAEALPRPARPKTAPMQEGTGKAEPDEAAVKAAQAALTPIIMDGIMPSYVADPRNNKALLGEAAGARPERANQFLRDTMFGLVNCYNAAGIHDYDWHVFGKDLRDVEWDYFSFDPPETMPKDKGARYRKVTYPAGMENWFAPDFDAAKAGWKKGRQPFGQLDGKLEPLGSCERMVAGCGCGEKPRTLWEKEVLLIRGTFEIPPLKDGHRYRFVVGGSNHVTTGEGYAIYINGKLLAESKSGVPNRQGGQPRGGYVYADLRDEFQGGKVTIAATSFLQYSKRGAPIPPRGHLTVWLEEQTIPPVKEAVAEGQ